MKASAKLLMVLIVGIQPSVAVSDPVSKLIKGTAMTGTNRLYGEPMTDFGPPLGTAGFYNIGVYDPHGDTPLLVQRDTPDDAVLATAVDPNFLAMAGLPMSLIDPTLENLPLQDVAVNISADGEQRVSPPSTLSVDPLQPNQALPVPAVTLERWLQADGGARISCGDDANRVSIRAEGLIPNRVYTVWGIFQSAAGGMVAVPLGGVPNVIATDERGKGSFRRHLGFCPFELTDEGSRLLLIDVVYHSDHQIYGFVPDLALRSFITGTVTHTQLEFRVSGQPLSQAD